MAEFDTSRGAGNPITSIKTSLETLTRSTARRPFGVGPYPADVLDFFHWGAFAEPTLWGIVYGAWQVVAASLVATLLPMSVYLVVPEASANSLKIQLGVMALSGVTSTIARIWVGMNANRFAWDREFQVVTRVFRGQHRRDIAWYVSRQWRWIVWANAALIATTVIAASADYQTLAATAPGPAQFALAQHVLWTAAGYLGAWMVGGRSFQALVQGAAAPASPDQFADDRSGVESGSVVGGAAPSGLEAQPADTHPTRTEGQSDLANVPAIVLSNGVTIPAIGFGTYKIPPGDDTFVATLEALRAGYRHIDTAALYENEESVGAALREFDAPRESVFVTTKVWNDRQGYAETLAAFDESLDKLGLSYVDLYLVHWPIESTLETTWLALEHLLSAGKVRAIGVCNFDVSHLERLSAVARVAPMVNQVELHPRFQRGELVKYCLDRGIRVEAWAPLMRGGVFEIPELVEIGARYGKSAGQVSLRWGIQSELVVLPKSVHPDRIAENIDVLDFELTPEDMATIATLDRGQRVGPDPDKFSWRWPESER